MLYVIYIRQERDVLFYRCSDRGNCTLRGKKKGKKEVMDALTYFDLTSEEFLAQRFAMGKDFHVHVHICIRSDLGATVIFCVFF